MQWSNPLVKFFLSTEAKIKCPVCQKYAVQSLEKQRRGQAMICPHCKVLFVLEAEQRR